MITVIICSFLVKFGYMYAAEVFWEKQNIPVVQNGQLLNDSGLNRFPSLVILSKNQRRKSVSDMKHVLSD